MKKKVTKKETEPKKTTRKTRAKTATTKKKAATKKTEETKVEPTGEPVLAEPTHKGISMNVPTPQPQIKDDGNLPAYACADPAKAATTQIPDSACKAPAHEGITVSAAPTEDIPGACAKPASACADPMKTFTPPAHPSACKSPDIGSACKAPSHEGVSVSATAPSDISATHIRPDVACAAFTNDIKPPVHQSACVAPEMSSACKASGHEGISVTAEQPSDVSGAGTDHVSACNAPSHKDIHSTPKHKHIDHCAKPETACFNPVTACATPTAATACVAFTPVHSCAACAPVHACAACVPIHACAACMPASACSACYSYSPVGACTTPPAGLQGKWKKHSF